ncbi:hypothetical protein K438DRAFT_1801216 [Mycena galopus ATCC 62051]|nr:hypothetical protein K438DRAFT_1801216 [Mycena galopus ATCC 62051]
MCHFLHVLKAVRRSSTLVIALAASALPLEARGCTKTYTVKFGDTCQGIEQKTEISDAMLHALNPAINRLCTNLIIGQPLCLN